MEVVGGWVVVGISLELKLGLLVRGWGRDGGRAEAGLSGMSDVG
jgi:hypothetical protein